MPSTVYKGDLTEISFGHETSLQLAHHYDASNSFTFTVQAHDTDAGTSTIRLTGGASNTPVEGGVLQLPRGMLVGAKLAIIGGSNYSLDDATSTGKIFTVVQHHTGSGGSAVETDFVVTPKLAASQSTVSGANDALHFYAFTLPSVDVSMGYNDTADSSSESVLTDQFLGLAATVTLPETKVDLKRYHVVGLGRDVAVQVPGRFVNEGGSFEVNMHNPRWLYYCLGMEAIDVGTTYDTLCDNNDYKLNGATKVGASTITYDGTGTPTFAAGSSAVAAGDYVIIKDTTAADVITYDSPDSGNKFGNVSNPETTYFDQTESSEIRRIVAITATKIFLDDALLFPHNDDTDIRFARFNEFTSSTGVLINNGSGYAATTGTQAIVVDGVDAREHFAVGDTVYTSEKVVIGVITAIGSATGITFGGGIEVALVDDQPLYNFTRHGSPDRGTNGRLINPVTRLLYSRSSIPSFAMEVSIRRRDSDGSVDDVTDGGATDTKQLTRVFRGCKVKDFSLTADTDAALRLTVNFDSALCYTDTGRLESSKGDRYNAHRMFEDTANTDAKRKESGIAKGTQKPYMFYNGTIDVAGVRIGQVVSFTLNGSTGVQQFYTINGAPVTDAETDQVPFAGARNASVAVEGKTEYNMDMEIIVDDPVFYHKMRRSVDHEASTANMIRLSFTKAGTGATRERIDILLDDYVIIEAPLPVPEDKGPIRAPLKIMPKAIRVISRDTLFHC
mgnify:CR=1 FL=1